MAKNAAVARFEAVFHRLAAETVEEMRSFGMPDDAVAHVQKLNEYTVQGGKMNRGLMVVETYQILLGRELNDEEYVKVAALGWAVEWMQAFFLVEDDIMDESLTRRGMPCWYKLPGVANNAINDGLILESVVYNIVRKHHAGSPQYSQLVDVLHKVCYQTELGQLLDLKTSPPGDVQLSRFNMDRYRQIVTYKTAYYSFYLPVALALIHAGMSDKLGLAEGILVEMGVYFQIQDDYLDAFADAAVLGKIGTDIQDNKCSWLIVQALTRCNDVQRQLFEVNYGRHDATKVDIVKALYRDLDLEGVYSAYEEDAIRKLQASVDSLTELPKAIFAAFLAKIAKRVR